MPAPTSAPARPHATTAGRLRPWLALVLALGVALVSGCGATIDTVLTIDASGKGTRAMTLTVAKDDVKEYTEGGMKAVDAAIKKHLPDELDYGGHSTTGDNHVVKFSLKFSSLDDYAAKVAKLVSLGSGRPFTPEIEMEAPDSVFRSGIELRENFSSEQLMTWVQNALVTEGVVAEDRGNLFQIGTTTVVHDDTKIKSTTHPIRVDTITDHGLSSAAMTTHLLPDGTFRRSIVASLNAKSYAANTKAFDDYFAKAKPEGGEIAKAEGQDGTMTWTITFTAADADAVAAGTAAVFGEGTARFEVTQQVVADEGVRLEREILDMVDCSAICSDSAPRVTDVLVVPQDWKSPGHSTAEPGDVELNGDQVAYAVTTSDEPITLQRPLPIESAEVSTEIGRDQSVHQEIRVTVATASAELAGDALPTMLTPPEQFGSLDTDRGDETTTYTISLSAENPSAFTALLEEYLPGSLVSISQNAEAGFFRANYLVAVQTSLDAFGYSGPIEQELSTPWAHSADIGSASGGTVSWTSQPDQDEPTVALVSGWTIPGIVVLVSAGVLVLAGAVVVVVLVRRNLAANRAPSGN